MKDNCPRLCTVSDCNEGKCICDRVDPAHVNAILLASYVEIIRLKKSLQKVTVELIEPGSRFQFVPVMHAANSLRSASEFLYRHIKDQKFNLLIISGDDSCYCSFYLGDIDAYSAGQDSRRIWMTNMNIDSYLKYFSGLKFKFINQYKQS